MNPAQLLNPKAFAKEKAKVSKRAPNYGPKQTRKPTASSQLDSRPATLDPRMLLNPNSASTNGSGVPARTAPNTNSVTPDSDRDDYGGDSGGILERHFNLTDRTELPNKRRKVDHAESQDLRSTNAKAVFNKSSNGGVISDHLQEERRRLAAESDLTKVQNSTAEPPVVAKQLVDLTNDDEDDDVLMTDVVARTNADDEVCMGMLWANVQAYKIPHYSQASLRSMPKGYWPPSKVKLAAPVQKNASYDVCDRNNEKFGKLEARIAFALNPVLQASAQNKIRLFIMLLKHARLPDEVPGLSISKNLEAHIVIFIPRGRLEAFGRYLSQKQLFLQNPPAAFCEGKEIVNPHVPKVFHKVIKDSKNSQSSSGRNMQPTYVSRTKEEMQREAESMFDGLAKDVDLPEEEPNRDYITTPLMPHQKQALHFLTLHEDTEHAENQAGSKSSLWKFHPTDNGKHSWIHVLTSEQRFQKPDTFQGGILADTMGLGKTLSILSLIAHTMREAMVFRNKDRDAYAKGTLIVVPLSVLTNWMEQIETHTAPETRGKVRSKFLTHTYHGTNRLSDARELGKYEIVLTTYQTVASELCDHRQKNTPLAELTWFRVVLDEAHHIRTTTTKVSKGCCALKAERRWALTGTPVQNTLNDLGALLKFLQIKPFDDQTVWMQHIMAPFKNGQVEVIQALQLLVGSITLRRLKDTIVLPERHESVVVLQPTDEEASLYKAFLAKAGTQLRIMNEVTGASKSKANAHVLKSVGRLRLLAAHGRELMTEEDMNEIEGDTEGNAIAVTDLGDEPEAANGNDFISESVAYMHLQMLQETETNICVVCEKEKVGDDDVGSEDGDDEDMEPADCMGYLTPCLHPICIRCKDKTEEYQPNQTSDGYYQCPHCGEYKRVGLFEFTRTGMEHQAEAQAAASKRKNCKWDESTYGGPHTKVKALIEDLHISELESASLGPDEPPIRSVVFSSWTQYLDLIEYALHERNFKTVRLDGTMSVKQRKAALDRFKSDRAVTVMLVSIKAGGQGLNFTAANKAYVMEPQFNPGVEQQAVDRIHRMGQEREVFITHYILQNTIEDGIRMLQKKKEQLAKLATSKKKAAADEAKVTLSELAQLFK